MRFALVLLVLCGAAVMDGVAAFAESPESAAEDNDYFEKHIRPLLIARCYECHSQGAKNLRGGLLLDSRAGWMKGGDSGPAIVPGNPAESLLIQAVQYDNDATQMPPAGKLPPRELEALIEWVKRGAPDPRDEVVAAPAKRVIDIEQGRTFWAFQPPRESELPAVRDKDWPQSPVDYFILSALEASGLKPAAPADRATLLRRLSFDLTGLPPTPRELADFAADGEPDAVERVVERLLASPRYGERWARHWLDVARYADSNGFDENIAYGNAWKYRDYVVQALNDDLPYDQFLREQLAGDLLPKTDDVELWRRRLIATGFLALGSKALAEPDKVKMEMDIVDEQLDTLGRTVLGLTLGCARCHDHKFDPLPTTDYYALAGIFRSTRSMQDPSGVITPWYENVLLTADELKARPADAGEPPTALGLTERKEPADLKVHIRGDHLNLGDVAPRGFPQVLQNGAETQSLPGAQSGRLELAHWITQPDHPLTGRVLVNRLWRWHFGTGIVRTPDNFGELGERPTNGPLLDWLAVHFVQSGWSIKEMHRAIVLSSTYQMSSAYDVASAKRDPENRLHWRNDVRRLEADEIRDALIVTAGQLDPRMGGTLLNKKNREFVFDHTSMDETKYNDTRRSIYLPVIRNHLYETFQLFDFPDPNFLSGDRATTTVAPQALFFLNSDLVMELTATTAERLLAQTNDDAGANDAAQDAQRVRQLYRQAFARDASEAEVARALAFVARCEALQAEDAASAAVGDTATASHEQTTKARQRAWQMVCQAIVAASEFIYVR